MAAACGPGGQRHGTPLYRMCMETRKCLSKRGISPIQGGGRGFGSGGKGGFALGSALDDAGEREAKGEARAAAGLARYRDRCPEQGRQATNDVEPEPDAVVATTIAAVDL